MLNAIPCHLDNFGICWLQSHLDMECNLKSSSLVIDRQVYSWEMRTQRESIAQHRDLSQQCLPKSHLREHVPVEQPAIWGPLPETEMLVSLPKSVLIFTVFKDVE